MSKCSINQDGFGQCQNKPTKYVFGIDLCDNHYHTLYNMHENTVSSKQMAFIIDKKLEEEDFSSLVKYNKENK